MMVVTLCEGNKTKLYIGGLFSLPTQLKAGTKGYHSLVGSEMALEDINRLDTILPDYEVVLLVSDCGVSVWGIFFLPIERCTSVLNVLFVGNLCNISLRTVPSDLLICIYLCHSFSLTKL